MSTDRNRRAGWMAWIAAVACVALSLNMRAGAQQRDADPAAQGSDAAEGRDLTDTKDIDPSTVEVRGPGPFEYAFDPIIITATRTEKALFDVPAFADVVTSQDIDEAMYRTVPEALRDVPGVMVQKTAHGQGSPYIRGFTGFRTLMLIDGIRLNNSTFRDGPNQYWNTVDPLSVQRLEVIKGPSSVLYGSDAIGGTVNAITKGPHTYGDGLQLGGRAYYRGATAERSHTGRGELSATWNLDLGAFIGGSIKDYGDLQSGAGRLSHTGYEELDGDLKLEYFLDENTRLVFAHQSVDQDDAWRTHTTIYAVPFEGSTVGQDLRRSLDQNRDLTYLQLHAEEIGSFIDTARFSVSYHSQDEAQDRLRTGGRRDLQSVDVDTIGLWAQFETPSEIGRFTYGVEYYRDDVDSSRRNFVDGVLTSVEIQGPVADEATYDLVGVYAQDDIPITEHLDVILGGRYTYARADADSVADPETGEEISVTENYDSLVGSARFVLTLDEDEHWNLFGGISQGFRAPNLSDLTRLDTARSNEIETPSPGLDPEHFIAYEIGVKARYEKVFAQASYFYTDIDEMIIRQPTGAIIDGANEVTKINAGDGFVHGIELQASWQFHANFTTFGSFAWLDGEIDAFPTSAPILMREPIDRLMPMTGQIGLRWDAPSRDVWLEGVLTIADDADELSFRDMEDTQRIPPGGTPGYAVLSLRSGWHVSDNFTITAAIDNVTDENYRIHGSGVNEPGVNFILGVEYTF